MNWYTRGDNAAYENLLKTADDLVNVTTENIKNISSNILTHSETECALTDICFEVAKICRSLFTEQNIQTERASPPPPAIKGGVKKACQKIKGKQ